MPPAGIEPAHGDPFDFSGRVVLITGCGSAEGIGFASAPLLAQLGARVAITSTTADRIEAREAELRTEDVVAARHPARIDRVRDDEGGARRDDTHARIGVRPVWDS